jgi:hypothetical protein
MNKRLGVLVSGLFLAALAVAEIGNASTGLPRPAPGPGPCIVGRDRTRHCSIAPRPCGDPTSPRCGSGGGAGTGSGSGGGRGR